ncbi:uncharacterized protein LOC8285446 [Ricinus communis]|uniref:uncharacterized protein LOC8285446 n=1 Tax=Ricinus communis TaxID=3988 RepID=UPI00201A5C29|nr:uncharacterized protein LOC8285446 [Ricinus communis]
MAKPGRDATPYNAVFIDTSLNTHFATIVSFSDTVSDLKQKIIHEHSLCFPQIGEINIHALKVKRKGCLYHLSDSMFVRSVFHGVNKSWFVKVDASSVSVEENKDCIGMITNDCANGVNLLSDALPNKLLSDVVDNRHLKRKTPVADDQLSWDVVDVECTGGNSKIKSLDGDVNHCEKENEIERTPIGGRESNSRNEICDVQGIIQPETVLETESYTKKKHKSKRKSKYGLHELALKEDASVPKAGKNELQQETVVSVVSQGGEMENGNIIGGTSTQVQVTAVLCAEGTGMLGNHVELKRNKVRRGSVDVQCDKSVEDTLQLERPAKKKRKIEKEKHGDEDVLKKDGTLIIDSNKEMIEPLSLSQHSLVDKSNTKNPTSGSSLTETLEDVKLQPASPSTGKRKRKRKLKDALNQEIAAVPSYSSDVRGESSGLGINPKDLGEEPDADLVPGQQGIGSESGVVSLIEKNGDPFLELTKRPSQEIDMSNSDAGSIEGRHDTYRSATASNTRSVKVSENRSAIDVEGNPYLGVLESENAEKGIEVSGHENMILGDHQNHVVYQSNGVEEQQNLALNLSSKTVPSEKYKPSALDELTSKTKEVAATSILVSETVNPSKLSKKKKKSRKAKELESGTLSTSVIEHVEGFVSGTSPTKPHKATNGDHSGDNVNKEESNVPPKEGKEVSEMETSASLLATEKEIDDVIRNAMESVQQIGQVEVSAENMDGKSRKKTKKKRTSDVKDLPELKNENEKLSAPAGNKIREAEYSSNGPLKSQSSQGQPHKTKSNREGRCLEAAVNGNPSKSGHAIEGTCNLDVSCESSGINFKNYFVPRQQSNKIVGSDEALVDKATKTMEAYGEMKGNENKKKLGAHSHGPSPDLQNSYSLTEDHGVGAKPLKVSDSEVKAPLPSKSDKLDSASENTRSNALKPSATSTHAKNKKAGSVSSLESSKDTNFLNRRVNGPQLHEDDNRMNSRRTSTINSREVVNGSQHKRSLIGVSDSIFKDVTDEASSTEDDNSDASTRTPSDKSLSSDYSDGESNADFNSPLNGSNSCKRKDGGQKTIRKPLSSGLTLDAILRSSSRYKKAKLTAAQLQLEDTESQPVEFVPDSQAKP